MATVTELSLAELRRDLHRHPEKGWQEFRTTALIAEALEDRGYTVTLGADALAVDQRLGVPPAEQLDRARERARDEGAPNKYLQRMGKITGLVAERSFGNGPVVGVRVDMDALPITEAGTEDHRPAREGFASRHPDTMHACGHDGHTAIGLGIARRLDTGTDFSGTIKLFFQPAEEGGRGGLPMSKSAHLDDIDHMIAVHLGLGHPTGKIIAGYDRPLSNAKVDVTFHGTSAHAGNAPHEGRNALQAATTAIQNLYGIPRHGDGASRINVGQVHAPNAQNVIADHAEMRIEVRGETAEINKNMLDSAYRIVEHAAKMHEVDYDTALYGKTTSFRADDSLVKTVVSAAQDVDDVETVVDTDRIGGSEDASYLIRRVQEQGGTGTYIGIGADNPGGHHTPTFDIDEEALDIGVDVVTGAVERLSTGSHS